MKALKGVVFVLVSSIIVLLYGLYHLNNRWSYAPLKLADKKILEIPRGMGLASLSQALEDQGLVQDAFRFHLWVRIFRSFDRYQSGTYAFEGKVSPITIDEAISNGEIHTPVILEFVIPEGFTLKQSLRRLEANGIGSYQQLWALAHDRSFIRSLGIEDADSLEGYLYPATYSFVRLYSPKEILSHMVDVFKSKLSSSYFQALKAKNLSLHQAVIFGSLIEKETKFADEKPKVAEVIWRRLKNGEPLGIDAAIIYGIKDYGGDIKFRHLRDRSNPYNTRIHKGLPPGPIGAVSLKSLEAVLNPSSEGYYYYVVSPRLGGRHHFSKTLGEHNHHVKLLIEAERRDKTKVER